MASVQSDFFSVPPRVDDRGRKIRRLNVDDVGNDVGADAARLNDAFTARRMMAQRPSSDSESKGSTAKPERWYVVWLAGSAICAIFVMKAAFESSNVRPSKTLTLVILAASFLSLFLPRLAMWIKPSGWSTVPVWLVRVWNVVAVGLVFVFIAVAELSSIVFKDGLDAIKLPGWLESSFHVLFLCALAAGLVWMGIASLPKPAFWPAVVDMGFCGSCGADVRDLPREADGCVVCKKCGAAWKASRFEVPIVSARASGPDPENPPHTGVPAAV